MLLLTLLLLIPMIIAEKDLKINDYTIKIDDNTLKSIQPGPESTNELNLSDLKLESVDNDVFENLTNLERLDLSKNKLGYVPSVTSKNLQYFSLAENFQRLNFAHAFVNLSNLKILNISENYLPTLGHGTLFGLSKSCDILTNKSELHRVSAALFENPFLRDSQLALEENEDSWRPSSFKNDEIDHPPWDTSRRIKICMNNGTVEIVGFMKTDEILSSGCEIINVDYKKRSLPLEGKRIRRFEKNWYRLGHFPINELQMGFNKIEQITSELLNDLPVNIKNVRLELNEIKHLENGIIENEHIRFLGLMGNFIENIEDGTFEKTKIDDLDLGKNTLKDTNFVKTLPRSLAKLWLYENKIVHITEDSFSKLDRLIYLDLWKNYITNIETNTFQGLSSLQELKLMENSLTNLQPGLFRHLKDLRSLDLWQNNFSSFENGTFEGLDKLEHLDLGHNKLSNLREILRTLPANLSELYLHRNEITSLEVGTFVDVPKRVLTLNQNKITKIASGCFNLPNLEELNIRDNGLTYIDGDSFVGLPNLKRLVLSSNRIQNFDKEMLKNLGNLESLDLDDNEIRNFEVGKFVNVPKESLYLERNNISKITSGSFNLPTLKSLYLRENHLSEFDGNSFAGLPKLETLHLNSNGITKIEKGAAKNLGNLRHLELTRNPIKILKNGALFGLRKALGACWLDVLFTDIELIQGGVFDDV